MNTRQMLSRLEERPLAERARSLNDSAVATVVPTRHTTPATHRGDLAEVTV